MQWHGNAWQDGSEDGWSNGKEKRTGPPTYPAPMQQILRPSWHGVETMMGRKSGTGLGLDDGAGARRGKVGVAHYRVACTSGSEECEDRTGAEAVGKRGMLNLKE